MTNQYIKLLKNHIKKLEDKEFEFEAWKKTAILHLETIFKKGNNKISALEDIKYDQGSWSLRDSSGKESFIAMAKTTGRSILEAAIAEIETLRPDIEDAPDQKFEFKRIVSIIQDELTGSQIKELKKIMDKNEAKAEELVKRKLKTWGSEIPLNITSKLLSISDIISQL